MAANRVSGAKAEKMKGKERKANRGEDVQNGEQDGIGLSEMLANLRSGSVKLTGDIATVIGGIIAQEPILVNKTVTTMSEAYCSKQAKRAAEATAELKCQVQVLTFRNDELEQYTRQEHYSWNDTTAFGPTFANVLKSQKKNQPNVGEFTFPSVI